MHYMKLYKIKFRDCPSAYYACDSLVELSSYIEKFNYVTIEYIEEVFVLKEKE